MSNLIVKAIETNAVDRIYEISKLINEGDVVVVSSFDKFNARTRTVIDLFETLYNNLVSGENCETVWAEIKNRFDKTLNIANLNFDLTPYYLEIEKTFKNPNRNFLLSRADFLTSLVISKLFNLNFMDAKDIIKFKNEKLNISLSAKTIRKMIMGNICIPNNYGVDEKENIVLSSNNLTASIIASSIKAKRLDILTSNDGIGITNKQYNLKRAENLSYDSAKTLSKTGAQQFLSDNSIKLLEKQKIPVFVKNIYLPLNQTIISSRKCEKDISSLAGFEFCINVSFLSPDKLSNLQTNTLLKVMQNNGFKFLNKNTSNSYIFSADDISDELIIEVKRQLELLFKNQLDLQRVSQIDLISDKGYTKIKNTVLGILEKENIETFNIKFSKDKMSLIIPQNYYDKLMTVLEIYAIKNSYQYF